MSEDRKKEAMLIEDCKTETQDPKMTLKREDLKEERQEDRKAGRQEGKHIEKH